jgi:hypothetical protein
VGFDFPNTPTEGQTFQPAGGPQYTYRSGTWQGGVHGALLTAQAYNRVVNGAMQISQENGSTASATASTGNYYMADQFYGLWSFSPGTAYAVRAAPSGGTPQGSSDTAMITIGTAKAVLATTDYVFIRTNIEGSRLVNLQWGTVKAKQVVVRFWFLSSVAGKYSFRVANSDTSRSYVYQFDVVTASAWIEVIAVIPGDTTGTWPKDTTTGMRMDLCLAAGTNYIGTTGWQAGNIYAGPGQVNYAATAGAGCQFADVGLYLDPDNTGVPPKWQIPDYASELAACQRYWQKAITYFSGSVTSSWGYGTVTALQQRPRVSPTLTASNLTASSFPATAGTPGSWGDAWHFSESRVANATAASGTFSSSVIANARM